MNLLRMIGQNTLNEPTLPVPHTAKLRRIRTFMQEMMFEDVRMIKHAGRWIMDSGFGRFCCVRAPLRACQNGVAVKQQSENPEILNL